MPENGRLDYLTRVGWVVGHAGIALMDPQKYVEQLAKVTNVGGKERGGIIARFVPGGPGGPETYGQPLLPPEVPDFPLAPQGKVPIQRIVECAACGQPHKRAWECLI